jgi:hypothetical protein
MENKKPRKYVKRRKGRVQCSGQSTPAASLWSFISKLLTARLQSSAKDFTVSFVDIPELPARPRMVKFIGGAALGAAR